MASVGMLKCLQMIFKTISGYLLELLMENQIFDNRNIM